MPSSTTYTGAIPVGFDHSRRYPQASPGGKGREESSERNVPGKEPDDYSPQDYQDMVELYLERRRPWAEQWLKNEEVYEKNPDALSPGLEALDSEEGISAPFSRLGRAYGIVHTLESMVFNRKPKLFVTSLTGENVEISEVFEELLNNEWAYQSSLKRETRLAVRDCIISGVGATMTFWDAEFEKRLKLVQARHDATDEARLSGDTEALVEERMEMVQLQEAAGHDPEKSLTWEADWRVLSDQCSSIRVSHWDLLFDPLARHWSQVQWIGRRLELPLWDILRGPFEHAKDLSPDLEYARQFWPESKIRGGAAAYVSTSTDGIARDLREWVTLYEIFDLRNNKLVTVAPGFDQFLRYHDNPYFHQHPYNTLQWNHRGEGLFATADLSVVYPLIREEENLRSKLQESFERETVDVYMVDESTGLGEEGITPLTGPDNSIFVPVRVPDGKPVTHVFGMLPRQPKSPDVLNHLARVERDIQQGLGLGPNQVGAPLKSATTASEAMEIAGFARSRGEFKYDAVEEFVAAISHTRLSCYAQFADESHVSRIAGLNAARLWAAFSFTKGDVQGRFGVKVEEGSVRPADDNVRLATFEKMFMMANQFPAVAQVINLPELLRRWFETLGIKDGDKLVSIKSPEEAAAILQAAQAAGLGGAGGGQEQPTAATQGGGGGQQGVLGALMGGAS